MGVSMSITKYAKFTDAKYADKGNVDEDGAEGADVEEAAAPALEANSETIDKIKQENFDKWSKIFRDLIRNKDIESKIKSSFNKTFLEPLGQVGGAPDADAPDADAPAADAPAADANEGEKIDINNFKHFVGLKIVASKDNVFDYLSGDNKYSFFLKEDIDKFWLVDEKVKELLDEETAKLIIELGKNEKKFKKANEEKYNEISDVVTKITKEIVPIMFDKTQLAVQHKALKEILDYVIKSNELKDFHKKQNISGSKEDIKSGEKTAKEVAMEKREAQETQEGQSGGNDDSSYDGYSSDSSYDGYSSDTGSSDSDSGRSYMSGGDNIYSGDNIYGGKSSKEKEYKKFKSEERKGFAEKKDKFMKDEVKIIAFLDENITSLMTSYEKSTVGVNVKKSSIKINIPLLEAIFKAVNSYEKEVETTGAAVEMIAKSGEAPAAEEGEAADGDKKDEKKGEDGTADDGDKTDKEKEEAPAPAKEGEAADGDKKDEKKGEAPAPAPAGEGGGANNNKNDGKKEIYGTELSESQAGGGHTTTIKTKKKCHPKKKLTKNINININLGKTNIAYEDTSHSSSSDSDSDSSSDSDSDSSSDSDSDKEQGKVIKKGKKQVKYVVNETKKKNRPHRRRQNNDEE